MGSSKLKIPWRRAWQPTPVFLFGEIHGQRSLVGYSPWGRKGQTRLSNQTTTSRGGIRNPKQGKRKKYIYMYIRMYI